MFKYLIFYAIRFYRNLTGAVQFNIKYLNSQHFILDNKLEIMNSLKAFPVLTAIFFSSLLQGQERNFNDLMAESELIYNEYLDDYEIYNGIESIYLKQFGEKVKAGFDRYLRSNGYKDMVSEFNWEFKVVKMNEGQKNILVLPGCKVLVSLDMFSVANNEAKMVWLITHGLAHTLLEGNDKNTMNFFRLKGKNFVGYTQSKELKADEWGAELMAISGYDPEIGVEIWKNLKDDENIEYRDYHPFYEDKLMHMMRNANDAKKMAKSEFGVYSFQ